MPHWLKFNAETLLKGTCTLIFVGMAAVETAHDLSDRPWGILAHWLNGVGFLLVPLWIATAAFLWIDSTYRSTIVTFGTTFAMIHGFALVGVEEKGLPVVYIAGSAIALILQMNIRRLNTRRLAVLDHDAFETSIAASPGLYRVLPQTKLKREA